MTENKLWYSIKIFNYLMFQLPHSAIRSTYFFFIIMKVFFFFNLCPLKSVIYIELWLLQWINGKESACNAGDARDTSSVPRSGRSPGGRHGKPLQYSCLENSMDRGAWWAAFHGISQSQAWLKWLSMHARRASSLLVFPFSGFPGYSCCLFFYVNFSIRLYISTRAY